MQAVKRSAFLGLAFLVFSSNVRSEDTYYSPIVVGVGNERCSNWNNLNSKPDDLTTIYAQWVLGVVSGNNLFFHPSKRSVFLSYDERHLVEFAARYCANNPDKAISESMARFFRQDLESIKSQQENSETE